MVSIDATARAHDGVTLVTAVLEGGPVPTRVSLANRLDGPVWPPRRTGEPEGGWDEDGYEGVVPAGERVALGYACPAPPDERPLAVVATERATSEEEEGKDGEHRGVSFDSASAVLRGLGSPAPPRDAVPLPAPVDEDGDAPDVSADDRSRRNDTDGHDPGSDHGADVNGADDREADLPPPVSSWLDDVEGRIERAEALADATDVPAATEAVRAVGSLDGVETLERRRGRDAEQLRELAKRANALAYRAESAAIPLDALRRLA